MTRAPYAQLSTMARGSSVVVDARGFTNLRAAISSGSSGSAITVSRALSTAASAHASSSWAGLETVTGSSVGASTAITVDWPYYLCIMSTGSTATTAGGWLALS